MSETKRSKNAVQARLECMAMHTYPCKNLLAIAPRSRRDDRDRGAMAAIAARLCISPRDLD